jgi:hypothetical protein
MHPALPKTSPSPTEDRPSRRGFLKGAAATGLTLAGVNLLMKPVLAQQPSAAQAVKDILTVARTAEQLAVTFIPTVSLTPPLWG